MRINLPTSKEVARSNLSFCIGIVLIGANLRTPITSLGPILPDITRSLHLGGSAAGLLNAIPLVLFALVSLIAPGVGRRYDLKRLLACVLASIMVGTIIRSLPIAGAIWVGTVVLSTGIAFANVLLPSLVKLEFPENAARPIGYYAAAMAATAGISAGLAVPIAQLPGSDWRWSLGCWALLALVGMLIWLPQLTIKTVGRSVSGDAPKGASPWRHIVGWQVSLFFAFQSFIFYSLVDWYASYAMSRGIAARDTGIHLLIYQIVAIATILSTGSFIKRSANQVALGLVCGLFLLAGCSGLLLSPAYSLLWLVCAGLGGGIAMVLSLSLFALRTHDHHQASALSGMSQFVGYTGAAAGPLLVGVLHDFTHGWAWPFGMLIFCSVLVTIFASQAGRQRFIE
jgi:CP family cyanate transporter-like MFS transporter